MGIKVLWVKVREICLKAKGEKKKKEFVDSLTSIIKKSTKMQKLGKARSWGLVKIDEILLLSSVLR